MTAFNIEKRRLLLATIAGALYPLTAKAAIASYHSQEDLTIKSTIRLHNIHTSETLVLEPTALASDKDTMRSEVNHFFRDHRANAECEMDMRLITQLSDLQSLIKNDAAIEVIGGYRSKATNEMLRKKSKNVARKSYHLQGRAVDIRIPGIPTHHLRNAAISMRAGGVGYYAKSDFIHLDTGPVRQWGK